MKALVFGLLAVCFASAGMAQDDEAFLDFSGDAFRAGTTVEVAGADTDDLFMAGETVRGLAAIGGSAHLAGRRVEMRGAVGGDVYAAGMDVDLSGDVAGDATVFGYTVRIGEVGGDLRATGANVALTGPVAGYVLLAGDEVRIDGVLSGDVMLSAGTLEFGPEARIDGTLVLYEKTPGEIEIPEGVIAGGRVERHEADSWEGDLNEWAPVTLWDMVWRFVTGVLVVAALAALAAAVLPQSLAAMRRRILDRPLGTLWLGFLLLSVLIGSAAVFAMTVIGLIVSPAALLAAGLAGFVGYVLGAYAFGVGLLLMIGRPEPASLGERALAGFIGALVVGLLGLVPFLGWLFILAVTLAGAGAMAARLFRPQFFAAA